MKKRIFYILILIIIICIMFVSPTVIDNKETGLGYFRTFLARHNYHEEAAHTRIKQKKHPESLMVNGIACAYDISTNTYYCPLSVDIKECNYENIDLTFLKTQERIYIDDKLVNDSFQMEVKFNHSYKVRVKALFYKSECNLVFTQTPTIVINSEVNIYSDNIASIRCLDPYYLEHDKESMVYEGDALVSLRGGMTFGYPKKNYKIKLYENYVGRTKVSLFGMRMDDDWILDASYIDKTKMRKKVVMDLWGDMSTVYYYNKMRNAPNSKHVEVFVNDKYCGLYILSERIDRKLLNLKENTTGVSGGVIYKTKAWRYDDQPYARFGVPVAEVDPYSQEWLVFDCEYPRLRNTGFIDWTPYYDLSHLVHADTDTFNKQIINMVDLDNLAEYFIFVNLIKGEDNIGKNIIWSVVDTSDDDLNKMFITAWDLDYSFGHDFQNKVCPTTGVLSNYLFKRLIKYNTNGFVDLINEKWVDLRESIITEEYITTAFMNEYNALKEAGCYEREGMTWHTNATKSMEDTAKEEIDFISNWTEERIAYLDVAIPKLYDRIGK